MRRLQYLRKLMKIPVLRCTTGQSRQAAINRGIKKRPQSRLRSVGPRSPTRALQSNWQYARRCRRHDPRQSDFPPHRSSLIKRLLGHGPREPNHQLHLPETGPDEHEMYRGDGDCTSRQRRGHVARCHQERGWQSVLYVRAWESRLEFELETIVTCCIG